MKNKWEDSGKVQKGGINRGPKGKRPASPPKGQNPEKMETVDAIYNWDSFVENEKGNQVYWTAINKGHIINLDALASKHVILFLEKMIDFFTALTPVTIIFSSSKGRLGKVRTVAKKFRLKYKKLGKIGISIHVGQINE